MAATDPGVYPSARCILNRDETTALRRRHIALDAHRRDQRAAVLCSCDHACRSVTATPISSAACSRLVSPVEPAAPDVVAAGGLAVQAAQLSDLLSRDRTHSDGRHRSGR